MNAITDKYHSLVERYEHMPIIRLLVQLTVIAAPVENAIVGLHRESRLKRLRIFFEELSKSNAIDNPELAESEDFVHNCIATLKFVENTRQREKIQYFARLLSVSSIEDGELTDVDEYEDFLKLLDELSYRELRALHILDSFSSTPRNDDDNEMSWTMKFWDDFVKKLCDELPLPTDEVAAFMTRVSRTGCYQLLIGYYDTTPAIGVLTPVYSRLKNYIRERA